MSNAQAMHEVIMAEKCAKIARLTDSIQAKFEVFHHAAVASDMTGEPLTADEKVKQSVMVLLDKHASKLNVRLKCYSLQATLTLQATYRQAICQWAHRRSVSHARRQARTRSARCAATARRASGLPQARSRCTSSSRASDSTAG
jgi:hypothetical protein